jgi:hypothetical protein
MKTLFFQQAFVFTVPYTTVEVCKVVQDYSRQAYSSVKALRVLCS